MIARLDAAFDAASGQLLLFGGDSDNGMGSPQLLSDTWNWDGTDWHRLPSGDTPPAAANPHIAYDVASRQVVLLTQSCECSGAADLSATQTWTWLIGGIVCIVAAVALFILLGRLPAQRA